MVVGDVCARARRHPHSDILEPSIHPRFRRSQHHVSAEASTDNGGSPSSPTHPGLGLCHPNPMPTSTSKILKRQSVSRSLHRLHRGTHRGSAPSSSASSVFTPSSSANLLVASRYSPNSTSRPPSPPQISHTHRFHKRAGPGEGGSFAPLNRMQLYSPPRE